jgi:hypothetical protein
MAIPSSFGKRSWAGFFFLLMWMFLLCPFYGSPVDTPETKALLPMATPPVITDTLGSPPTVGTLPDTVSMISTSDSIRKDTISKKKKAETITHIVDYSASDSLVILGSGLAKLYRSGSVVYGDMKLNGGYIQMDMDSSLLYAIGIPDSIGKIEGDPVFKDKGGEYKSKELKYNFHTGKGLIKQAVTQQGEGYIVSGQTKKVDDNILCMVDGKYTTCDNKEHPHFYLKLSKAKVKQGNWIASGPAHLVMEDVDLPLFIPFGFFPFKGDYSSGFLMPTYGDELDRGFYLSDMGYYFAFNDYIDLAVRADIYSKGSWGLKLNSTYRKRYKYSGGFTASYIQTVTSEKNLPDYAVAKDIRFDWRHTQDSKSNPNQTFSASVNFATSGYTRNDLGSLYNNRAFSENQKSSSVSFSQKIPESPFSISSGLSLNQVTKDTSVSVSFPNLSVSMSSIYPFKRKNAVGDDKWYERIRVGYSGKLANSISDVKEYEFFKKSLIKDWSNGVMHNVPVSADFTVLNYININTSLTYNERWYSSSLRKSYDQATSKVVTDTTWGFNRVWDYSVSTSASTKFYGMYQMNPKIFGRISQIRHVITPSISFSYRPDFGAKKYGYWGEYSYVNSAGETQNVKYSRYSNGLYGVPSVGESGSIGFALDNNFEMKWRQETDTATVYKKVSLIDAFHVGASYNLAADSLKLSNIDVSLRIRFGSLYTLNLSTSLQPYTYILNSSGNPVRVNRTQFEKYGIPGRITGLGTSMSYTLGNETFKKLLARFKKKDALSPPKGDEKDKAPEGEPKPEEVLDPESALYAPAKLPWSISFSYSIRYSPSTFNTRKLEYNYSTTQNLSLSGSLSLTSKWSLSGSSSYDFETKKLNNLMCSFTRDLHCWSMSGSFIPIGDYKSYNITIAVKSSLLSDLKYEQRQNPRDNYIWK